MLKPDHDEQVRNIQTSAADDITVPSATAMRGTILFDAYESGQEPLGHAIIVLVSTRAAGILSDRDDLVRRGKRLEYFTIAWMSIEALASIAAGLIAGSISLIGFGFDSFIEIVSGAAVLWRLRRDFDEARREHGEKLAVRAVGSCFLALAGYVLYSSILSLVNHQLPKASVLGIVITSASLVAMPMLRRAKDRIGVKLESEAMRADAKQAAFCAYLSGITLAGLVLNALFGIWWTDPVAALAMSLLIAREGAQAIQGKACCT